MQWNVLVLWLRVSSQFDSVSVWSFCFIWDACGGEVIMCWISSHFLRSYSFRFSVFCICAELLNSRQWLATVSVAAVRHSINIDWVFACIMFGHQYSISWGNNNNVFFSVENLTTLMHNQLPIKKVKNCSKTDPTVVPRHSYTAHPIVQHM